MFFEGLTLPPIKKLHVLIAEGLGSLPLVDQTIMDLLIKKNMSI